MQGFCFVPSYPPMHELAQINVVQFVEPIGSPRLESFVAQVAHINALAEASPGFVWRYKEASDGSVEVLNFPDGSTLGALSVWRDIRSLKNFVYGSGHSGVIRRRREWMVPLAVKPMALWWVSPGERPSLAEGWERLQHLRNHGPTLVAFSFASMFDPSGKSTADLS